MIGMTLGDKKVVVLTGAGISAEWRQDIQGQRRIVGKPPDRGRCHARSMGQGSLSGLEVLPGQEETVAGSGSQSCPLGAGSSGG